MNKKSEIDQILFLYILLVQARTANRIIEESEILKKIAKLAIKNYI